MKKYRYKFGNGLAHLESKDIRMLEDMAAEGYAFIKVNTLGFYKFERAEPEVCSYSVDFTDINPKCEAFPQYKEMFEASGWEYRCSADTIHYFKAPKGTIPIYTDPASMAEKYERMRKFCVKIVVVCAIIAAIFVGLFALAWRHNMPTVFPLILLTMAGAFIGTSFAMFQGMLINKGRVEKLHAGVDIVAEDSTQFTAEAYEKKSKSSWRRFWLYLFIAVLTALEVFVFQTFPGLVLRIIISGIMGGVGMQVPMMLYSAITNKRRAAEAGKQEIE